MLGFQKGMLFYRYDDNDESHPCEIIKMRRNGSYIIRYLDRYYPETSHVSRNKVTKTPKEKIPLWGDKYWNRTILGTCPRCSRETKFYERVYKGAKPKDVKNTFRYLAPEEAYCGCK